MAAHRGVTRSDNLQRAIATLAVVAVALGIFARLSELDHQLFWFDEAYSMLRITGHTDRDYYALFDGSVRPAAELAAFQHIVPKLGLADSFASLAFEEPQRGPLYYLAARVWGGIFGDGVAEMRSFSAVLGIVGIGLGYLLGRRMTGSRLGGLVLAALVAVSPFHILYSQQVREYVLFADVTLLSAWLLLRALERPTWSRFLMYAAGLGLGLYSDVEFGLVVLAHVVYVFALRWREGPKIAATSFVLAAGVALAIYAPWAWLIVRASARTAQGVAWTSAPYPIGSYAIKWIFNLGAVFFDYELADVRLGVLLGPILIVVAYAAIRMFRGPDPAGVRWLVIALTGSVLVPLIAIDLLAHSHMESVTRYQVPTWIGVELAVAIALTSGLAASSFRWRAFSSLAFAYLIGCGVFAAFADRGYVLWWDNNEHISEASVGAVIATEPRPVVLADADHPEVLVLTRYLPSDAKLLLFRGRVPDLPRAGGTVLFFLPTAGELRAIREDVNPAALRNVSPPLELAIPDLRSDPTQPEVNPQNTLWMVVPKTP
jgi:uncharacterized membrane protein